MFGTGNYATVWGVEDHDTYSVVELSTSAKTRDGKSYETDFSHKFVRFVGKAHSAASSLQRKDRIRLGSCGVTNFYDKDKQKEYVNFKVFDFEMADTSKSSKKEKAKTKTEKPAEDEDDDLPF